MNKSLLIYCAVVAVAVAMYTSPNNNALIPITLVEKILKLNTIVITDTLNKIKSNTAQAQSVLESIIDNVQTELPTSITSLVLSLNNYIYFAREKTVRNSLEPILKLVSDKFSNISNSIEKISERENVFKQGIIEIDHTLQKSVQYIESSTGACVRVVSPVLIIEIVRISTIKLNTCGTEMIDITNYEANVIQNIITNVQTSVDEVTNNIDACLKTDIAVLCLNEINELEMPKFLINIDEMMTFKKTVPELLENIHNCINNVTNEVEKKLESFNAKYTSINDGNLHI